METGLRKRAEIVKILEEEGFKTQAGKPLTIQTLDKMLQTLSTQAGLHFPVTRASSHPGACTSRLSLKKYSTEYRQFSMANGNLHLRGGKRIPIFHCVASCGARSVANH